MNAPQLQQSVRAASFQDLKTADRAVCHLLQSGFSPAEITVVCSDDARENHFRQFEHQEQAGTETPTAVGAGVTIGAAVGGLVAIAVGTATGAVPLIIAGVAGVSGGSAMGGFLGAMISRGGEKELSNFYDQAIRQGRILVAVEVHGPEAKDRLVRASNILAAAGSTPVPLPEG